MTDTPVLPPVPGDSPGAAAQPMGRRGLLARLAMGAGLVLSYGSALAFVVRYLLPTSARGVRRIYVGRAAHIPVGQSLAVTDLHGVRVLLTHTEKGFRALSSVCTHLGCRVQWVPEKTIFFCPCHNGVFNAEGVNVAGPPPRPLDRFAITEENGVLYMTVREA